MQKHNKAKPTKLMAGMLSGAMALSICMTAVYATPVEKYQENVKKRNELQVQMGQNKEVIDGINAEKSILDEEYEELSAKVAAAQTEVDELDEQLAVLNEALEIAQQEMDDRYSAYCARVREVEEYGNASYWSIIFQATDLKDLLGRIDYVQEVMSYDQKAMDVMDAQINDLTEQEEEVDALRAERNFKNNELKQLQRELSSKIQEKLDEIDVYALANADMQEQYDTLMDEAASLTAQINGQEYSGTMDPDEIYQQYVVESGEEAKTPEGAEIVKYTLQFNGGRYVWGGASPETGFDCSGLMYYVYGKFGYFIQRTASYQYTYSGTPVDFDALQAGDLVFFHKPKASEIGHVGMYIGDGLFVHAASSKSGIKVSSLYSTYYSSVYAGAKRIIDSEV